MRSIHAASSVGLRCSWNSSRHRHSAAPAPGDACSRARTVCDDSSVGMFVHSFALAVVVTAATDTATSTAHGHAARHGAAILPTLATGHHQSTIYYYASS